MSTRISVLARCEHRSVEPIGTTRQKTPLWAAIRVEALAGALERERAPLALALVLDVSGSMQGAPLAHVVRSAELLIGLLGDRDHLALITFADHAGVRAGLTRVDATGRADLGRALRDLRAGGSTNLAGGIEVGAGVLVTAPAGLRRAMVVLSDGQPNVGRKAPAELEALVRGLGVATSSLGFGADHDEKVLAAIARAGSGRYAYIPDPVLARVELARAALAHGGIVADRLELRLEPADGVELVRVVPSTPLRVGARGVTTAIGDVFVDEHRVIALELAVGLDARATGRLAALTVTGRDPDGATLTTTASLDVDVRAGAPAIDRDAQRDVVLVCADAARAEARAEADRRAFPAAAALLRAQIARIDATVGFVANDGSPLAELREQLVDEAESYATASTDAERGHQHKTHAAYTAMSPMHARARGVAPSRPAVLIGLAGPLAGQRFPLAADTSIGRSSGADIAVASSLLSRMHARIVFVDPSWLIHDGGSSNGTYVNGAAIHVTALAHGDVIRVGDAELRFELITPPAAGAR